MATNQALAREPRESLQPAHAAGSTEVAPKRNAPGFALLELQHLAGNRAVTSMLARSVQRDAAAPSRAPAAPARTPAKPAPAPAKPGAPNTKLAPRNSYIDLLNAFQDLAAAAINRGGAGLDTVRFGGDLTRAHRSLIWQVRTALIQAQDKDRDVRLKAAAWWPSLAGKLMAAVEEARQVQLPGESLAAVVDQVAMLNRKYVHARPGKADPEVETAADYVDSVNAANALLWEFSRMGESGQGIIREEVPGRKDILVSQGVLELNAKQRGALNGVKFGTDLNKRHRKTLDSLRKALLNARAEAPGSAYRALTIFRSIQGELRYIAVRAPTYQVDTAYLKGEIPKTAEALATHYQWVHQDNIRHALTKERSKEEVKTEQAMKRVVGKGGEVAIREMRAVQDLRRALEVIERSLVPSPDRPDEWILTSGGTVIRVRADQALALRSTASKHLKEFMATLVSAMAQVYTTYDSIKRGNSSFKLKVLGGLGGASDPGDQSSALNLMINQRDKRVYPLVDQGRLVDAFKDILHFQEYVQARAKEVGAYDEDLDIGYKRLATIATVVQVALVALVPVVGQAAIASGAGALVVGGTSVVAGAGGAAYAETGRQIVTGEDIDPAKIGKAAYKGGVIGAGAIAPVATKQLGVVFAGGGTGTTLVGANALAAGTVGAIHSKLGGGSAGEGFVGGAVGSMAGSAIPGLGPIAQKPLPNTLIQGGVGAGTAALTGGDPIAGAVGGISGAIGARVAAPRPGGGAPPPAPGGGAGGPRLADTTPGTGIIPRPPASPITGETRPGVGITARGPAAPGGTAETRPQPAVRRGTGSADTEQPRAKLPDAPSPARPLAATVEGAGAGSALPSSALPSRPEPLKGRTLLPESEVPRDLTPAAKPAFDLNMPREQRGHDPKRDITAHVSSTPTAPYAPEQPGRYVATSEKPTAGISASKSYVVQDMADNNKKHLFKPLEAEQPVERAEERGIRAGEQAPREAAAPVVAEQLGVQAAKGRLVTINGQKGVLIEWKEKNTLRDLALADYDAFQRLVNSKEFKQALASLDALDYLINNLDRAMNFGNYLYEFTPGGTLTLTAIDHGLTFTSTKARAEVTGYTRDLPEAYPSDLRTNLKKMDQNRSALAEKIRPLVGDEAVAGVMHRLDVMLKDMALKHPEQP